MNILINWIISALVILAAAYLIPGVHVANIQTALVVAVVLGILNAIIKPILILLTLPLTIMTLGLFTLVINAALILLTAKIIPHNQFQVDSFWWALLFSIVMGLINFFVQGLEKK